ncbi:MAP7 domain-containing protein 3 isoform X1 [Varanus komodoensis]|uniref:MAP7 domain-containing protein 3 isoform X1 n=1 Tax=Varanus komodoensis TaxID=61221 RepID=UPI001CF7E586|nr:MAP7 domain-containing protein 3 isoform X1 [Varanus komodoensis]
MAEGTGAAPPPPPPSSLKGLREQMVAAAQALAEERRNQSGVSPVPVQSPISVKSSTKPVIDGSIMKSEERQRLARERREEREKQHAAKETQILEKEKKAKLQYEKQMEEKQRKLREQKLKEQQRRAAVEEKRKQKIEEEKERYEAVVHRTLERSQRLETRQKRWSWGGSVTDSDGKSEPPTTAEASKRSPSAANLKQAETVISKRLSSSAALLNSPSKGSAKRSASLNRLSNKVPLNSEQPVAKGLQVEQKGETEKKRSSSLNRMSSKPQSSPELESVHNEEKTARRSQFNPLDSNVISRLLAPTQASLARSKSAATLSADGKDPSESPLCPRSASSSSISSPVHAPKVPMRSRSIDRLKPATSSSENVSLESAQKSENAKQSPSCAGRRAPSPSLSAPRRSPSPAHVGKRPPSPAAIRQKPRQTSPNVLRQRPPSPITVSKPAPIQRPSLTPNVLNVTKKKTEMECRPKEKAGDPARPEPGAASERETAAASAKTKEDASSKTVPGTTTAEEAAKILAEKRRLAREQREREGQERVQREEEERIRKEEMAKRALEEQAQMKAALQELEEERRAEEEEQQKLAAKERVRKEQEEQEKLAELQLQREEAEMKALEEAERQRQERERIMQQNMQERMERKKRIEEIMKRTRKAEQNEAKNEDKSNDEDEGAEEDEELGLEKQDQPEKAKYDDCSLEDGPKMVCNFDLLEDESKMEADDVFVNGNEQEEADQSNNSFAQTIEDSPPAKETFMGNSEILHVNEANHPIGFISNLNGKSSAWNFEEIIDLGLHPKSSKRSSDSLAADLSAQNFNDAAAVPSSPKLAFEEESAMNSLTKPIEAASGNAL